MVESEVRPNRGTDTRVLGALLAVPRELFLPERLRGVAYVDEALPVAPGRYLMEPMVFARLLQTARIKPIDTALEIGGATGYGAAVIAQRALRVVALEDSRETAATVEAALRRLDVRNVKTVTGLLADGYPADAPYDVIVFGGAVEHVPSPIADQLAEGGRLLAVIPPPGEPGPAPLITPIGGAVARRVGVCRWPPAPSPLTT